MNERYVQIPMQQRPNALQECISVLIRVGRQQIRTARARYKECGCQQCRNAVVITETWWDGPQWKIEQGQGNFFERLTKNRYKAPQQDNETPK